MSKATSLPSHRSKKVGLLLVAGLVAATAAGHLATRDTSASASLPAPPLTSSDDLVTLTGKLDRTRVLAGGDGEVKMELSLAAADVEGPPRRAPVDVIVILDRSGSMGGAKIEAARAAVLELVDRLAPGDRMGLVAFANGAEVLIPLREPTPVAREAWRRRVAAIAPGGGTDMSRGLDLALELAPVRSSGNVGRMLLISDGEANQGDSTPEGLMRRARRGSQLGLVLSSIGVGEHFNEFLMSSLADAGTGNYYYLAESVQLAEVFAAEFDATRETVARAVAVTIEPAPGVEVVEAAGYPLETTGDGVTFYPGTLFAGQERRLWVTLRLPNAEPGEIALGTFRAVYDHDRRRRTLELPAPPRIACVGDRDAWLAGFDRDAWSRAVVEEDYGELRQRVAGYVKAGRREEALKEIRLYETRNQVMNERLASDDVASNLEEVKKLEADVNEAFRGRQDLQAAKQNRLSKAQQAASVDDRRAGAKKKAPGPKDEQP